MDFYQDFYDMDTPMVNLFDKGFSAEQAMYPESKFVKKVQNCSSTCFHMVGLLVEKADCERRRKQIKLLHDCARICGSQAIYTVMDSIFSKTHAKLCAKVCEMCAAECSRFPDRESQHCAEVCLDCAEACKRYAMM